MMPPPDIELDTITSTDMLDELYGAFAPACFALLGLWLAVVQIRIGDWRDNENSKRMSYVIVLNFLLPGLMGVLSLVDPQDAAFWRASCSPRSSS
jgi:hypothetical protein